MKPNYGSPCGLAECFCVTSGSGAAIHAWEKVSNVSKGFIGSSGPIGDDAYGKIMVSPSQDIILLRPPSFTTPSSLACVTFIRR